MVTNKQIRDYVSALLFIVLFIFLFNIAQGDLLKHFLIYFLVPAGLFLAFRAPYSLLAVNGLGLFLLFMNARGSLIFDSSWLLLMFLVSSAMPFYGRKIFAVEKKRLGDEINGLALKLSDLKLNLGERELETKRLQNEVEKITKLYLLAREFVDKMEIGDTVEQLKISIFDRPDIKSISFFVSENNVLTSVYNSNPEDSAKWKDFAKKHFKELSPSDGPRILETPRWLNPYSVVVWPITIEEGISAVIFIASESSYTEACIEEGKIFIPQIALNFRRIRLFEEVREKSRRDGLTGLYLRRYFIERLDGEIQRAKRYGSTFSLLMIDIDWFKNINDVYGHLVGDTTLKELAKILSDSLRPGDLICRYGGEEFIVLLPLTSREGAAKIAARISKIISEKEFLANYRRFKLTVSIGISHYSSDASSSPELIETSDKALYWVKTHGRNGVKEYRTL